MVETTDSIFINRELSWLDFDSRVLALAKEKTVPLGERIKFAAIFVSNMDEFFMVRVGSLYDQTLVKGNKTDIVTHMTASEQIAAITPRVAELQAKCDKYYQHILTALAKLGYQKVDFNHLSKEQEHFWKTYFQRELFPMLSPQIVDQRHPFPFLRNKETYFIVQLNSKLDGVHYGIVPISSQFERVLFIKDGGNTCFAFVEELIAHYAAGVFGKTTPQRSCLFRVTRNADITVDEGMMDHDIDFRDVMSELLKKRRKLAAVRLQFWPEAPQDIVKFLRDKLVVPADRCYAQITPLDAGGLYKLASRISSDGKTELFYPAARPLQAPVDYDLYAEARRRDVLLAYPYQSIRPFIRMLLRAGVDPNVVSIKMTLYRMAADSQIVQALIAAAENGKEVVAMVELRARFDEQNNIDWSKQLQDAGCTVFYGFDDYKVHSKLTLITSRVDGKYHYITQIGTGNYNEKTSELYSDLSFITSRQEIGEEANAVFNNMAVQRLTAEADTMLVAPLRFKSVLLGEMDRQIALAKQGRPAAMVLKNNSINDPQIIDKISEASCAGVRVDMIVRGICCVRAGVPGKTENVHIRSLVGRYLEHSRIYSFGAGEEEKHIYIASGDFLTRNTERRVEVGVRVDDPKIAQKLRGILELQLKDTVNARQMQPDGSYTKVKPGEGEAPVDSQMAMYAYFQDDFAPEPAPKPEPPKPAPRPQEKAAPKPAAPKPAPQPGRRSAPARRPAAPAKRLGLLGTLLGRKKK